MSNLQIRDGGQIQQINQAISRQNMLTVFVRQAMVKGTDYGTIPGCGNKLELFQPGAEKLVNLFNLSYSLALEDKIEQWDKAEDPLFMYRYRCEIRDRSGAVAAVKVGSCNSKEPTFRYVQARRECPSCGQKAIQRSRYPESDPNRGYFCNSSKGGCNAKFEFSDDRITSQKQGKVLNPDIFSTINTIEKMAQKRAFVGAVKAATNSSNFFAQGLQETVDIVEVEVIEQQSPETAREVPFVSDSGPAPNEFNPVLANIAEAKEFTGFTSEQVKQIAIEKLGQEKASPTKLTELESERLAWLLVAAHARQAYLVEENEALATLESLSEQAGGLKGRHLYNLAASKFQDHQATLKKNSEPQEVEALGSTKPDVSQWFALVEPLTIEGEDALRGDLLYKYTSKPSLENLTIVLQDRTSEWPCWNAPQHRVNARRQLFAEIYELDPIKDQQQISLKCQQWIDKYWEKCQKKEEPETEQMEVI